MEESDRSEREATLALVNGRVFTVDEEHPWAQAVAVSGDRILRVGTDEEVVELSGPRTITIDVKNRLVLPGFIDSHIHTSMAYEKAIWANLNNATSFEEIAAIVKRHAEEHPDGKMIGGTGWWYEAVMSGKGYPTKKDLDSVISDKPVLLVSYDGWVGLGNSALTEMAEESFRSGPSWLGGMDRDPETGEATGVFHNPGDLTYLAGDLSALIREKELDGLKWVFGELPRYGITGVHDALSDVRSIQAYQRLKEEGTLSARAYIALAHHKSTTDEDLDGFERARKEFSDEWIRTGAVKLFIDGVLDSHTAALLEPYDDDPASMGETKYSPDEFKDVVTRLDRRGFQCVTHSCGDRGVRVALDAYEYAARKNGKRDGRHRIEHIEMLSKDDVPRFRELGVIASMQPIHAVPTSDKTLERAAGPRRMMTSFPWGTLDRAGAKLAFSSDWSVADMNPLLGIHAAVTRNWRGGSSQAVSLEKAIEAYTINGAYASFEENIKGSIEAGKLADFVVLSNNLFEIPAQKISEAEVVLTIVGGEETYRAQSF